MIQAKVRSAVNRRVPGLKVSVKNEMAREIASGILGDLQREDRDFAALEKQNRDLLKTNQSANAAMLMQAEAVQKQAERLLKLMKG